jgi:hypothetical protein
MSDAGWPLIVLAEIQTSNQEGEVGPGFLILPKLCSLVCRVFKKLMNESLIRLILLGREFSKLLQQSWIDPDSNELAGWPGRFRSSYSAGAAQLLIRGFRNIREINL